MTISGFGAGSWDLGHFSRKVWVGDLDRVWGRTDMDVNRYTGFTQIPHTPCGTLFWVSQRNAPSAAEPAKGRPWVGQGAE